MDTRKAVKSMDHDPDCEDLTPDPDEVQGECPDCGDTVISNLYHARGRGYFLRWECVNSLGKNPTCSWRRTL